MNFYLYYTYLDSFLILNKLYQEKNHSNIYYIEMYKIITRVVELHVRSF